MRWHDLLAEWRLQQKMAEDDNENHLVTPFLRKLPNGGLSWYDLMDKMIGSKKQRFSDVMLPPVGIPQAPRLPEEIRIQRAMDSCLFKSVMSCVIGEWQLHVSFMAMLTSYLTAGSEFSGLGLDILFLNVGLES